MIRIGYRAQAPRSSAALATWMPQGAPPAALDAIASLALQVNVIGVIPASENLPGGRAIKPGDILKSDAGEHVKALNTDAEGRLILGDALAYAMEQYKGVGVLDLAMLTASRIVAQGYYASGAISNAPAFQEQVVHAADRAGDPMSPLPNLPVYGEALRGKTADLQNTGFRECGAITAACTSNDFAGQTPWVHPDIAGTAWGVKTVGHIPNEGATGVGVVILVDLAAHARRPWTARRECGRIVRRSGRQRSGAGHESCRARGGR